jgi:hypothetical protein
MFQQHDKEGEDRSSWILMGGSGFRKDDRPEKRRRHATVMTSRCTSVPNDGMPCEPDRGARTLRRATGPRLCPAQRRGASGIRGSLSSLVAAYAAGPELDSFNQVAPPGLAAACATSPVHPFGRPSGSCVSHSVLERDSSVQIPYLHPHPPALARLARSGDDLTGVMTNECEHAPPPAWQTQAADRLGVRGARKTDTAPTVAPTTPRSGPCPEAGFPRHPGPMP